MIPRANTSATYSGPSWLSRLLIQFDSASHPPATATAFCQCLFHFQHPFTHSPLPRSFASLPLNRIVELWNSHLSWKPATGEPSYSTRCGRTLPVIVVSGVATFTSTTTLFAMDPATTSIMDWDESAVHVWFVRLGLPQYENQIRGWWPGMIDSSITHASCGRASNLRRGSVSYGCRGLEGSRNCDDWSTSVYSQRRLQYQARPRYSN